MSPIETRNLIYHVCPLVKNDLWRRNVEQLLARAAAFNGRRVVAIATGSKSELCPPCAVRTEMGPTFEYLEVPNCKRLREVASFKPLLCEVQREPGATFYAHTKGNSTAGSVEGSTYWRNVMYWKLLGAYGDRMRELERYHAVGTHKMVWKRGERPPYPTRLMHGHWMFAGTFFWFRNDSVYSREWRRVPNDRYGAEAWLSGMFEPSECHSCFQPAPAEVRWNPYSPALYEDRIADGCFEPALNWSI